MFVYIDLSLASKVIEKKGGVLKLQLSTPKILISILQVFEEDSTHLLFQTIFGRIIAKA